MADDNPTVPRPSHATVSNLAETQVADAPRPAAPPFGVDPPAVGGRVGEFLLLEELGTGSFGQVFLAGQEGLNRRVALKLSRLRAMSEEEGKALGGLEHDHIVKVYAAFTPPGSGWHCLCLQYVPGADLRAVIGRLHEPGRLPTSGRAVLDAVDAIGRRDGTFDPAALRDRDALAADDFHQAICRLGGQLAEALAFAHAKGVLHCDIKPGNILLTPYGRPMLADFNVAFDSARRSPTDTGLRGTIAYMAPEYLAAAQEGRAQSIDERCDLYSLGVVLYELATGTKPHPPSGTEPSQAPASLDALPRELALVIRRCLEPNPDQRYQNATELASALAGAWHLLAVRRALPPVTRVGRWVIARPVAAIVLAGFLPHLVASVVNISYNEVQIDLTDLQTSVFEAIILAYNLLVYPASLTILVLALLGINRGLRALPRADGPAVDALRRRSRRVVWLAVGLGCLGWFPGAVLFPLVIDLRAGPISWATYAHYAISFTLSGLIGVVFSFLGVVYVVFLAILPRAGHPDTDRPGVIGAEIQPLVRLFGPCSMVSCAVPLAGAVLLVVLADGAMTLGFRLLVVGLIGLGMGGVGLAAQIASRLSRLAAVWGPGDEAPVTRGWDNPAHKSGYFRQQKSGQERNRNT